MTLGLSAQDVAVRLGLTIVVGLLIGFDRSTHGKAAGMRTTVLVALAASVAMIQVNLLLPTAGRAKDSFVMNDLMRLPLGILTGMGFIGGGAILRRGDIVVGVTTAATLWLVTVIGLCIGGGQLSLALAATVIGLFALRGLSWIEGALTQERTARLNLEFDSTRIDERAIRGLIRETGTTINDTLAVSNGPGVAHSLAVMVRIIRSAKKAPSPNLVERLAGEPGMIKVELLEVV